jgi:hypothetical protein
MGKLTLISHFYNEEYMLPWWLNHHKKLFDHGILIDYDSTDNSVDIIKEICPTWTIVKSANPMFSALAVDKEVQHYERQVEGYKMVLNTTEFLVGNPTTLPQEGNHCYGVYRYMMVDNEPEKIISHQESLIENKTFGARGDLLGGEGTSRRYLHNYPQGFYGPGRHDANLPKDGDSDLIILMYYFSPWTQEFKNRKLQIRNKIPQSDLQAGMGHQHTCSLEEYERLHDSLLEKCNYLKIPKQETWIK